MIEHRRLPADKIHSIHGNSEIRTALLPLTFFVNFKSLPDGVDTSLYERASAGHVIPPMSMIATCTGYTSQSSPQ